MTVEIVVVVGLAAYRLARLTVADAITRPARWAAARILHRSPLTRWVVEGPLGCMWCSSVWWAAAVTVAAAAAGHVAGFVDVVLVAAAAAAVAGLAATWAGDLPDLPDGLDDSDSGVR